MFMQAFEIFVQARGLELRITRYALFQSIFRVGEADHVDVVEGRALFDAFFSTNVGAIEPAPGARDALATLAPHATIVILTNAPAHSRQARARWLTDNGFPYPLLTNSGLKGPVVAALSARTTGAAAFVDDLLPNLDSVAAEAPKVFRFQMVADERLRPLAPSAPHRHVRIDAWSALGPEIARVLRIGEAGS